MEGEGAGELALDDTNLVIRAARALAAGEVPAARPAAPAQADPARRRAWPAAAPTRPPRWSPATRSGAPGCPATTWPDRRRPRLGRAVPGPRRHRARHRPRRGGQPGAGPRPPPGTGWSPIADGGPVHPRRLPRARPAARSAGRAGPRGPARRAARRAAPARPGRARRRASATTCRPAALHLRPALAETLGRRARRRRARRRSSPAPGRPASSSRATTARHAALAAELADAGCAEPHWPSPARCPGTGP